MVAWLAPMAISAGASLIGNAMSNRSNKRAEERYDRRMAPTDRYARRMGQQGQQVNDEYLQRIRSFDPMQAATQASQAQYALAMPQIKRQLADLRGSQVGQGRLRTGFGQGDQDQLLTTNLEHLNQSMIQRAMQAAQMQQATTSELGAYGQNNQNMYLDYATGRERTRYEQEQANRAGNRSMIGSLLGAGIQGSAAMYGR